MVVIGNFGEVAFNYFDNSDSFLNIAYGAVRSGKTIVATFRFLEHVFRSEHDKFLICGKYRDTIRHNILYDMLIYLKVLVRFILLIMFMVKFVLAVISFIKGSNIEESRIENSNIKNLNIVKNSNSI